jgi:hypothetical protein
MLNGVRPVDMVHFAALALMSAGCLAVWNLAAQARWALMVDLLLIAVLAGLVARLLSRCDPATAATVRMVVSVVLVSVLFTQMSVIVPNLHPLTYDGELLRIDREFLGFDPNGSFDFLHARVLTDLFSIGYFSFYFIPVVFFVILYKSRSFDQIESANLAIIIGFYVSFLGNAIFPAMSPFRFIEAETQLAGLWFYEPLHHLVDKLEPHKFSAFPSGHILVAAIVVLLAAKWRRDVLPYFLLWAVVLWLGTIYLRYHYLIDTLVSLGLAPLCVGAARLARARLDGTASQGG